MWANLHTMKDSGFDTILSPYHAAVQTIAKKDPDGYLMSRAAEIREPARQILGFIRRYQ
jgi:hypothetical protein